MKEAAVQKNASLDLNGRIKKDGIPMLPAWVRIAAAIPDFQERLNACVEEDNRR